MILITTNPFFSHINCTGQNLARYHNKALLCQLISLGSFSGSGIQKASLKSLIKVSYGHCWLLITGYTFELTGYWLEK